MRLPFSIIAKTLFEGLEKPPLPRLLYGRLKYMHIQLSVGSAT